MAHETTVPVKAHIASNAEVPDLARYQEIYRDSLADPDGFWARQAEVLHWEKRWDTVSAGGYEDLDFTWFAGGRLNACHNAVDRHVDEHGDRTAIIWAADEPGTYEKISYRELQERVSLRSLQGSSLLWYTDSSFLRLPMRNGFNFENLLVGTMIS